MLKKFFIMALCLGSSSDAMATTKFFPPGQPSSNICSIRGTFEGVDLEEMRSTRLNSNKREDAVYWRVDIREVSSKEVCPDLGKQRIRIRGATYFKEGKTTNITYGVGREEPAPGESIEWKVQFVKGKNSNLERDYEEWIYVGGKND